MALIIGLESGRRQIKANLNLSKLKPFQHLLMVIEQIRTQQQTGILIQPQLIAITVIVHRSHLQPLSKPTGNALNAT